MNINKAIRDATGINRDDFDSDLNAMHEAEKTLKDEQYASYEERVYDLVAETDPMQSVPCEGGGAVLMPTRYIRALSGTAAQRAEAFLRTLGKWEARASSEKQTKEDGHA